MKKTMAASQGLDLRNGIYTTPLDFLKAVHKRFPLAFDLAADKKNNVLDRLGLHPVSVPPRKNYFTKNDDSLKQEWAADLFGKGGVVGKNEFAWLNPPFSEIKKWTHKAVIESIRGARVVMLLPSATGTRWFFNDLVNAGARIEFLIGRLTFVGHKNCYPKDLVLAVFGTKPQIQIDWWDWRI